MELKGIKAAIVGTRQPKYEGQELLRRLFNVFKVEGIFPTVVRSGNAEGTDQVANFWAGLSSILVGHYLPWSNYNIHLRIEGVKYIYEPTTMFDELILQLFPHMANQKPSVWNLVRRNCQIVMGTNGKSLVDIVFWHTASGSLEGGTAYAVKLARHLKIRDIQIL
jgi:hypothetical protein